MNEWFYNKKRFNSKLPYGGREEYGEGTADESHDMEAHMLAGTITQILHTGYTQGNGASSIESDPESISISRQFRYLEEVTDVSGVEQVLDIEYTRCTGRLTRELYRVAVTQTIGNLGLEAVSLRDTYELGFHGKDTAQVTYMQLEAPDMTDKHGRYESRTLTAYDRRYLQDVLIAFMSRACPRDSRTN